MLQCGSKKTIQNAFSRRLRLYNKYELPKPNTEAFERSYSYISSKIFNCLRFEISSVTNANKFKTEISYRLLLKEEVETVLMP